MDGNGAAAVSGEAGSLWETSAKGGQSLPKTYIYTKPRADFWNICHPFYTQFFNTFVL
jgi:hypothetical protein